MCDEVGHVGEFLNAFPELYALPLIAPIGLTGGVAGLAGLAGIQPEAPQLAADVPPAAPSDVDLPAASGSPVAIGAPGAPTTAPVSAPAAPASTVATSVPASPPPPAAGPGFVPPYAVGPPGIGTGSGMAGRAGAGDKRKAAEPFAAAAAAVGSREQLRSRRRRRGGLRGYAHEFMEMNINVDPDWGDPESGSGATSDRGAGPLGFAGTGAKSVGCNGFSDARRRRIRRRAGAADGAGSWTADQYGEAGQGGEHD